MMLPLLQPKSHPPNPLHQPLQPKATRPTSPKSPETAPTDVDLKAQQPHLQTKQQLSQLLPPHHLVNAKTTAQTTLLPLPPPNPEN